MKRPTIIAAGLILLGGAAVSLAAHQNLREPVHLYKNSGMFYACPPQPNCVSSTADAGDAQWIAPIDSLAPAPLSLHALMLSIEAMGGEVVSLSGSYLHAQFATPWLRFRDDLELLVGEQRIQVRSVSRVGYADFGANRRRIETLRNQYRQSLVAH